jgi:type IV secretion system protein VirD4
MAAERLWPFHHLTESKRVLVMQKPITVLSSIVILFVLSLCFYSLLLQSVIPLTAPWVIIESLIYGSPLVRFYATFSIAVASALVIGFLIRYFKTYQSFNMHGEARFANWKEVVKYGLTKSKSGIILGEFRRFFFVKTLLIWDIFKEAGHFLLVAPTRAGKGVAYVIPTAFTWPDSLLALDIKGEIFEITSGYRASRKQKVLRFAPGSTDGNTCCFNPLETIDRSSIDRIKKINRVAESIWPKPLEDRSSGNDEHFNASARILFRTIALLLMDTQKNEPVSIPDILSFVLASPEIKKHLTMQRQMYDDLLDTVCKEGINDILQKEERELGSVISTFKTKLEVWSDPLISAVTRTNDVHFDRLRKDRISIYFCVSPDDIQLYKPLITLFFDQALATLQAKLPDKDEHKVLFLMDEFARFGKLSSIKNGISDVAGYNLVFFMIIQGYAQLIDLYGPNAADNFISNCKYRTFFAPNEPRTADFISRMLGDKTEKNKSVSRSKGSTSITTNEAKRRMLTDAEVQRYDRSKAIVFGENQRPIEVAKLKWYEIKELSRRQLPPHEGVLLDLVSIIKGYQNRYVPMPGMNDDDDVSDDALEDAFKSIFSDDD